MKARPITDDEFTKLLHEQEHNRYAARGVCLFTVLGRTGLRISEALSIRIGDVMDTSGKVLGSVTVARTNCKGKKESRTIPLHHQVRTAIEVLVANMEDKHAGAYVFQSQKGGRLSRIQAWRLVKQAARSLGEIRGISPHSFRKFLGASVYRISGRCIVTTQRALGHSSVQWTPIYVGIADAEVKTAILSL